MVRGSTSPPGHPDARRPDLYVSELAPVTVDLESVFLELTGTAPVPGQHRQVDESAERRTRPGRPQGGWGV